MFCSYTSVAVACHKTEESEVAQTIKPQSLQVYPDNVL